MNRNYRRSDPPTSALAGQQMGMDRSIPQRAMCLAAVVLTPEATAREIEKRIGIKAHKRLPELRADGLLCNGPTRTCCVTGRRAMTWQYCPWKGTSNNGAQQCH